MIDNIQRKRIAEKLLSIFYRKGYIPSYKEFISLLTQKFRFKEFGKPFFMPRGAARGLVVDPVLLKENVQEIKEDLEIAFSDLNDMLAHQIVTSDGSYGEFLQLRQKLQSLSEDLDTLLLREYKGGSEVLFDNFRNSDKVDLQNTTAYVDTTNGYVTLPVSPSSSIRYSSSSMKLSTERYSPGYKSVGGPFLNVFNDFIDQTWQAQLPEGGFYQIEINITGKDVIAGHANEVEINKIVVDPISPLTISIEGSTDGLNWTMLANDKVSTTKVFELDPTWVLFLRFTITDNTTVGIRRIEVSKVGTADTALFFSKALTTDVPLYNLEFDVSQDLPYGTTINHYLSTDSNAGWLKIFPGPIKLDKAIYNSVAFYANNFTADSTGDPGSLWSYSVGSGSSIVANSGELWRGIGQFKVNAFQFNFDVYSDTYHIPDVEDWNGKLGSIHSCYMESAGVNSGDNLPTIGTGTFIFNYINTEQDWWGIALKSTSGNITVPSYNYKLTTYLYSDRDILIENFAGGVYVRNPNNTDNVPSVPDVNSINAWGWAVYINEAKVASDNKFYSEAVPGSGSLVSTKGKTFPVSIQAGWNKIEVLLYVPSTIDPGFNGYNAFLLFRPNLFNFSLATSDQFSFAPKLAEYPIWADGKPMSRVSEFYLKWNVAPWDYSYWSWRLDSSSGNPAYVLLNHNPALDNYTIDGVHNGSMPSFNLKYAYIDSPINTIYYKAELRREQYANQPPKINSYRFMVTL
jgi:hypothetical protein